MVRVQRTLAANDPLAYGFKAARPVLETVAQYVHEQGLSDRRSSLRKFSRQHARCVSALWRRYQCGTGALPLPIWGEGWGEGVTDSRMT